MKQDTYNKQSLDMWEGYSQTYSKKQNCPSVFTLSLINMLRIADASHIIEAGCGAGYLHPYLISKKNPQAHLTVLDFSQEMIKLSAARVLKFLNQKQPGSLDKLTAEEFKNIQLDHQQLQNINYHPFVGSVEDMSQFKDNCFDVYLSNLCFQLVDNQEKAIAEAYRIMAPGGKIGVSVWGKRDNCNAITLISDAMVDAEMMQQYHSPKFIDDKSIIIQKFKDAGFTNILCWNQIAAFDIYCYEDMENYSNLETVHFLESATQEKKDLYKKAIEKRIQEKKDQNIPFIFECIMVIAQKPL